ncbi:MAG TPA: cyanophycinase, partial [Rectinemataceae bacterium]|nr:cyanophycinase [Rectinemataceae bacterium]
MTGGNLLIVGGAEKPARAEIMRAFVELSAGREGCFLVCPAATEDPLGGLERMRSAFAEVGVDPARVRLLELSALVPGWEGGARDPRQAELARTAAGIWFLGGDQNRAVELLLDETGGDTALLAAIREASSVPGGPVLGGTSAGAAIMSHPMIAAGTSFGALALPRAVGLAEPGSGDERRLLVRPGLGFFPEGIVDQHFDARSRLGRLVEAALVEDGARRLAF